MIFNKWLMFQSFVKSTTLDFSHFIGKCLRRNILCFYVALNHFESFLHYIFIPNDHWINLYVFYQKIKYLISLSISKRIKTANIFIALFNESINEYNVYIFLIVWNRKHKPTNILYIHMHSIDIFFLLNQ